MQLIENLDDQLREIVLTYVPFDKRGEALDRLKTFKYATVDTVLIELKMGLLAQETLIRKNLPESFNQKSE